MTVSTYEGIVEKGQIRLLNGESLPERATVYVVVPDPAVEAPAYEVTLSQNPRMMSPRLTSPDQASHFVMDLNFLALTFDGPRLLWNEVKRP